jgi:hypothetical protein
MLRCGAGREEVLLGYWIARRLEVWDKLAQARVFAHVLGRGATVCRLWPLCSRRMGYMSGEVLGEPARPLHKGGALDLHGSSVGGWWGPVGCGALRVLPSRRASFSK